MISRRHLLAALATIPALPVRVFGQDAPGRGQQRDQPRDTTPLVPPFEPTGWKTVWLDHLNYQCVDYRKAAAFYATLMGWKVRSDDGKQALLDIGENSRRHHHPRRLDGAAARGDHRRRARRQPAAGAGRVRRLRLGHRALGHRQGEGGAREARTESGRRSSRRDYQSFRVKDPDGFDLAITNGTKAHRRKGPANAKLPAPAPFEPTGWNTLYLDHISFEVPDFRRSAAFYQALLGWTMRPGNGTQASAQIGDIAGAIIRGNAAARAARAAATLAARRGRAARPRRMA